MVELHPPRQMTEREELRNYIKTVLKESGKVFARTLVWMVCLAAICGVGYWAFVMLKAAKYGAVGLAAAILVVVGVVGYHAWSNWSDYKHAKEWRGW